MLHTCPGGGKAGAYEIPTGVTCIGEYAFCACAALTDVTIPDSVTSIRDVAFLNCTSLTNVTLPKRVRYMGMGVFKNCPFQPDAEGA